MGGERTTAIDPSQDDGLDAMVIRVWTEPDSEHRFRARLTSGTHLVDGPSVFVAADAEEVVAEVRRWLETLGGR